MAMMMGKKMGAEMEDDKEDEGPDEWEIQSAADCLIRAEEIKKDAAMMKLVKPYLEKKLTAITSVAQLREKAKGGFSR